MRPPEFKLQNRITNPDQSPFSLLGHMFFTNVHPLKALKCQKLIYVFVPP